MLRPDTTTIAPLEQALQPSVPEAPDRMPECDLQPPGVSMRRTRPEFRLDKVVHLDLRVPGRRVGHGYHNAEHRS